MSEHDNVVPIATPAGPPEELPYRVELWQAVSEAQVERVLARAQNAALAHAIFAAARSEHPGRRITLCRGVTLIVDTRRT